VAAARPAVGPQGPQTIPTVASRHLLRGKPITDLQTTRPRRPGGPGTAPRLRRPHPETRVAFPPGATRPVSTPSEGPAQSPVRGRRAGGRPAPWYTKARGRRPGTPGRAAHRRYPGVGPRHRRQAGRPAYFAEGEHDRPRRPPPAEPPGHVHLDPAPACRSAGGRRQPVRPDPGGPTPRGPPGRRRPPAWAPACLPPEVPGGRRLARVPGARPGGTTARASTTLRPGHPEPHPGPGRNSAASSGRSNPGEGPNPARSAPAREPGERAWATAANRGAAATSAVGGIPWTEGGPPGGIGRPGFTRGVERGRRRPPRVDPQGGNFRRP